MNPVFMDTLRIAYASFFLGGASLDTCQGYIAYGADSLIIDASCLQVRERIDRFTADWLRTEAGNTMVFRPCREMQFYDPKRGVLVTFNYSAWPTSIERP